MGVAAGRAYLHVVFRDSLISSLRYADHKVCVQEYEEKCAPKLETKCTTKHKEECKEIYKDQCKINYKGQQRFI